jgi:hypothetical protein
VLKNVDRLGAAAGDDLLRGRVHRVLPGPRRGQGRPGGGGTPDEPAPSMVKLVDWLPRFFLIAGIFGWASGAVSDVVRIGMIVAGIRGTTLVDRFSPVADSNV